MPDEHHSTSNDDDYYTDMPDLLTDDEETDDEESVYQLEALESLESYMYVGRSTHQSYLTLVDHFYVGRSRARPGLSQGQQMNNLRLHVENCLGIPRIPESFVTLTFYGHSTSNDDNYYTDMPDLLTDDEETDDEESVN
jgi:hypothetical protein